MSVNPAPTITLRCFRNDDLPFRICASVRN
jgi:hypothetical protein